MKRKIMTALLVVSMGLAATGCAKSVETIVWERGSVEGTEYVNELVGIKAVIPEGFVLSDEATIKEMEEAGREMVKESFGDKVTEEQLERSSAAVTYDMMATTEDGSGVIQIMAEDTEMTMGRAINAASYLKSVENTTKTTYENMGLTVNAEEEKVTLGGLDFEKATIAVDGGMQSIKQEYYIHQVENYVYCIILTATEAYEESVEEFIDSIAASK